MAACGGVGVGRIGAGASATGAAGGAAAGWATDADSVSATQPIVIAAIAATARMRWPRRRRPMLERRAVVIAIPTSNPGANVSQ
jgi:hypothetical protein